MIGYQGRWVRVSLLIDVERSKVNFNPASDPASAPAAALSAIDVTVTVPDPPDAGLVADGGPPLSDGGLSLDGGAAGDGGADGGDTSMPGDGGSLMASDGGLSGPRVLTVGCNCDAASSLCAGAAVLVAVLLRARRRRVLHQG